MLRLLLEKKNLREANPLAFYEPHPVQEAFHKANAYIRLFCGGNRSGKTTALVAEALWTALGIHPNAIVKVPNHGRIITTDFGHGVSEVIFPKIMEWVPKDSVSRTERNQQGVISKITFNNGSTIGLFSYEQEVTKFEGKDLDWVAFDEPPPREIYIACTRGLIDRGGFAFFALTPLKEPWIYDELWIPGIKKENKEIQVFLADMRDNPHIAEEAIKRFEETLTEDEKEARLHGRFRHLSGRVYKEFDEKTHVIPDLEWPKNWPVIEAIDPAVTGRKPHAVVWLGVTKENNYLIIDELYDDCNLIELAEKILEKRQNKHVVASVIDPSINVNDGIYRLNQREVLEKCGIRTSLASKKDNLLPGVEAIKRLLMNDPITQKPKLYVFSSCTQLIFEFNHYIWDEFKHPEKFAPKTKPRKKNDDLLDALRYAIMTNITFDYNPKPIKYASSIQTYGN